MLKRGIVVLLAVGLLAGCGAQDRAAPRAVASSPSPSPVADLRNTCPKIEAALDPDIMVPSRAQLKDFRATVQKLYDQSDLEGRNALRLLLEALDEAQGAYAHPSGLLPKLKVSEAFDQGISAFATRCRAAGSSALQ